MVGMTIPRRPPKRKPRGRHPHNALTPAFVRNVSRPGRYCDGNGLYLDVRPTGSRGWIQRLTIRGRRTELGLGGYPLVSLKEAREKAFANRKMAREGGDPLSEKRRAKSVPTFAEAARKLRDQLSPGWRSPYHAQLWLKSLERHAFSRIGQTPISEVTSGDVVGILAPIWHREGDHRSEAAAAHPGGHGMGRRNGDSGRTTPATGSARPSAHRSTSCEHMPALPHREVASAIEQVRASSCQAGREAGLRVPCANSDALAARFEGLRGREIDPDA